LLESVEVVTADPNNNEIGFSPLIAEKATVVAENVLDAEAFPAESYAVT
jgi:hypothetical protein